MLDLFTSKTNMIPYTLKINTFLESRMYVFLMVCSLHQKSLVKYSQPKIQMASFDLRDGDTKKRGSESSNSDSTKSMKGTSFIVYPP